MAETLASHPAKENCEAWLQKVSEGIGKIHGWQRTLRPGQTKRLQESLCQVLLDLAGQKLDGPEERAAEIGFLPCGSLADLCIKASAVLVGIEKAAEQDFSKLAEKLRAQATTEARLKMQDSFNEVGKELLLSELPPAKALMDKFNSVYRKVAGLKLSEDLVPNQVDSDEKKDQTDQT